VNVVTSLEADFKRTLQRQASLEQWAGWLEAAVKRALRPHENSPNYPHHARQFLLKWSFYRYLLRIKTARSLLKHSLLNLLKLDGYS
jgi:regulatory factor X 1/2/3